MDSDPRPPRLAPPPVDRRRSPLSNANTVRHKLASVLPVTPGDKLTTPTSLPSLHAHTADTESKLTHDITPESTPEPLHLGERKRKKKHSHVHQKKHKQSSVDACTLFVTRLPTPGEPVRPDKVELNGPGSVPVLEPRPRSLRVSLSIQDDCDGSVKVKTPSPPQATPPQATSQNDDMFPTVTLISPPKRKPSVISQTAKIEEIILTPTPHTPTPHTEKPSLAFTASPLPVSHLPSNNIPEFITIEDMFELSPPDSCLDKPLSPVEKEILESKETQSKDVPKVARDKPVLNIDVQGSKVSVVKLLPTSTTPSCEDKITPPTVIVHTHKALDVQTTPVQTTQHLARSQAVTIQPPTTPPNTTAAPIRTAAPISKTPPHSTSVTNTTKPNTIVPVHSKPTVLALTKTDAVIRRTATCSSVVTTPTSNKRPWTDDVIITAVETNKKPKVDSPSLPKPSNTSKKVVYVLCMCV